MKKLLTLILAVVLAFAAVIVPVNAVYDENVVEIATATLDGMPFYGVENRIYTHLYNHYDSAEEGKYEIVYVGSWYTEYLVPADDFEAELGKRIVITDALLENARRYFDYDAEARTYIVGPPGGMGGSTNTYVFRGYVDNVDTYDVYYDNAQFEWLSSAIAPEDIPEGMSRWDYMDTLYNPEDGTYTYKGNVYESRGEGPVRFTEFRDFGMKFTIEINDGIVRVLSYGAYTAEDLPEKFEAKPDYDINGDNNFNMFDYVSVKNCVIKGTDDEALFARCDINGDGKVNIFDYVAVKAAYFAQ